MRERLAEIPLVVDLDGTLINSDMLVESANSYLATHRFGVFSLIGLAFKGRAALKSALAEGRLVDVSTVPVNSEVVDLISQERALGRKTVLATATAEVYAHGMADRLGLFDEVLATTVTVNLKGASKAQALVGKFGRQGFDYVGDSHADLAVWKHARSAVLVSPSRSLTRAVRGLGVPFSVVTPQRASPIRSVIRELRVHQWVKNLLIFVPLIAAHSMNDPIAAVHAVVAGIAISLVASGVYVLNDLVDLSDDRQHARKRNRPLASGAVSISAAWLLWPSLIVAGGAVGLLFVSLEFTGVLAGYVALTMLYSFTIKQRAILDVITLAALYTLRIVAGAVAIQVPLTFWLVTFSMFFFLSLAMIKRFSELKTARDRGTEGRLRGRGYSHEDLELVSALGVSSGFIAVLVFALYIQDAHTAVLYKNPQILWLAGPVLLLWISRAWLITHRGEMHDDPIVFALKDRASWLMGLCVLLVFIAGVMLP